MFEGVRCEQTNQIKLALSPLLSNVALLILNFTTCLFLYSPFCIFCFSSEVSSSSVYIVAVPVNMFLPLMCLSHAVSVSVCVCRTASL